MKVMKKALFSILALMLVLVGCGKSEKDEYLTKHTAELASYMRSVNIKVYKEGDSINLCKSETMCFRFYVEELPEPIENEQYYKINKMTFYFEEIKPNAFYRVTYPDKVRVMEEGDDPEIVGQLEEKFQEQLAKLGYTWEEFDDFIIWFAYVDSLNFKGTHLFEDDYLETQSNAY